MRWWNVAMHVYKQCINIGLGDVLCTMWIIASFFSRHLNFRCQSICRSSIDFFKIELCGSCLKESCRQDTFDVNTRSRSRELSGTSWRVPRWGSWSTPRRRFGNWQNLVPRRRRQLATHYDYNPTRRRPGVEKAPIAVAVPGLGGGGDFHDFGMPENSILCHIWCFSFKISMAWFQHNFFLQCFGWARNLAYSFWWAGRPCESCTSCEGNKTSARVPSPRKTSFLVVQILAEILVFES